MVSVHCHIPLSRRGHRAGVRPRSAFSSVHRHRVGHKIQHGLGDWEEQELTSGYTAICTTVQTHLWPLEVIAPQFFPSLLLSRGTSTSCHAALRAGPDVAPSPLEPN